MKSKKIKLFLTLLPIVVGLGISFLFIFFVGADVLVEYIGTENAYVLMFTVAAFSGLSTFNSVPYYSVLLVLANTGVSPVLLGTASALGVMTGDSFSYFIGRQGSSLIPSVLEPIFDKINNLAKYKPNIYTLVCFLYGSMCPLSNDFITISSGMARISYLRVMLPLALGNIVFNIAIAYTAIYAHNWLVVWVG
jgi:membrane protein YqaA with SNARE-associated domain